LEEDPLPEGVGEAMNGNKKDLLNRLATIEGHVKAIKKMVQDDAYCVDVLRQSYAVERALKKFEGSLLESHISSCVPAGFRDGRDAEMIRELHELFELSRK
jgi:CsoR family transcriptional regulator, copper-sensing transcriptional repressor